MKKTLWIWCCLVSLRVMAQQDPQYTMYMFNQVLINPAYAGAKEALVAQVNRRVQWTGMPGKPETNTFTLHSPFYKNKLAAGIHGVVEKIGPRNVQASYVDFAYRFATKKGKWSFGLSTGFYRAVYNRSIMEFKDIDEPMMNGGPGDPTALDISTGVYYFSSSFYFGWSASHINRPDLYNSQNVGMNVQTNLSPHSFLILGKGWEISDAFTISPSICIKSVSGSKNAGIMDLNCNVQLMKVCWLGISLRQNYGMVFIAQYMLKDKFRFGYSYDIIANRAGSLAGGAHEIMLQYAWKWKNVPMISPRYF